MQVNQGGTAHDSTTGPAPRSLAEICDETRLANCGQCWQVPGLPCVSHPETGAEGYHVARFARAMRRGLISGPELVAALAVPQAFTNATVIYDDQDDYPQPHCATCGATIGLFYDMEGWRHFRGDPAPGGERELFDAGHRADVVWGGDR